MQVGEVPRFALLDCASILAHWFPVARRSMNYFEIITFYGLYLPLFYPMLLLNCLFITHHV